MIDTELRGFMAGLLRTRRSLDYEEEIKQEQSGPDPFMHGYRQGLKAREEIIGEAVERVVPNTDSRERLEHLLVRVEELISDLDAGNGFSEEELRTEAARARVHLKETAHG